MLEKTNLPKFSPEVYVRIILTDLVVYSIRFLHDLQGSEITSEDVISTCFLLFPKRFGLRKYPHWPDSAVVGRRWSELRAKGLILGSTVKGFKLTAKGFRHAERVGKLLGGAAKPTSRVPAEVRTRAGRYVRAIESSDAYHLYKKSGKGAKIGEFDFRSLLLCTMESPSATLARNLEQFKEYARISNRKDLLDFLDFCGERFSNLLEVSKRPPEKKARKSKK